MQKFMPHILFVSTILLVLILGILTNSGAIGMILGTIFAHMIDPFLIVGGLAIGFWNRKQSYLFLISVGFGIIASLVITNINTSFGAKLTPIAMIARCISTLAWAYIANFLKLLNRNDKESVTDKNTENKANPEQGDSLSLVFKEGQSALEYACKYMDCSLDEGSVLPGIVLDSKKEFGTDDSVKIEQDGSQLAMIRVASGDGGFLVAAKTKGPVGPKLEPGQLVAWQAIKYIPELGEQVAEKRFGWVGQIIGTLKNEFRNNSWVGGEQFAPK